MFTSKSCQKESAASVVFRYENVFYNLRCAAMCNILPSFVSNVISDVFSKNKPNKRKLGNLNL